MLETDNTNMQIHTRTCTHAHMCASQTHTAHKTNITETDRHRNRHTEGQTQGQIHSQDSLQAGTDSDSSYNRGTEGQRVEDTESVK